MKFKDILYGQYQGTFDTVDPIEEAIIILQNRVENLYTFTPISELGKIVDGDITEIMKNATENIGIKKGEYFISSDCEVNAFVHIAEGAVITVTNNATVTFNKTVFSGRSEIFKGGTVYLLGNDTVNPEWFGAKTIGSGDEYFDSAPAFIKTLSAIPNGGKVSLKNGAYAVTGENETYSPLKDCYYIGSAITISNSNIDIGCDSGKALIFCAGTVFSSAEAFKENIHIHNIMFYRTDNGAKSDPVIDIDNMARSFVDNIRIVKSRGGVRVWRTTNLILSDIEYSPFLSGYSGNCNGFYINSERRTDRSISPNASIRFIRCMCNFYGTTTPENCYGFIVDGNDQRDIFLLDCEVASGNGIWSVNGSDLGFDIYLSHWVHDQFTNYSIKIEGLKNSHVVIDGGYISPSPTADNGILAFNSCDVTVSNMQIQGDSTVDYFCGVRMDNNLSSVITACEFLNCYNGVQFAGRGNGVVTNCIFTLSKNEFTSYNAPNIGIDIQGNCIGSVMSNSFQYVADSFKYTKAILSQTGSIIIGNIVNGLNIGSPTANRAYNV